MEKVWFNKCESALLLYGIWNQSHNFGVFFSLCFYMKISLYVSYEKWYQSVHHDSGTYIFKISLKNVNIEKRYYDKNNSKDSIFLSWKC